MNTLMTTTQKEIEKWEKTLRETKEFRKTVKGTAILCDDYIRGVEDIIKKLKNEQRSVKNPESEQPG